MALAAALRNPAEGYQRSMECLEQAVAADDANRARLAWVGAVDAVLHGGAAVGQLRVLMEQFDGLDVLQRAGSLPLPGDWIRTLVSARALSAALLVHPNHQEIANWRGIVESQWRQVPDIGEGVQAACYLVWELSRRGRRSSAGALVRKIEAEVYAKVIPPATQLCLSWARAACAADAGCLERTLCVVREAESIAQGAGIEVFEVPLAIEALRARLAAGQVDVAASECRRLLGATTVPPAFAGILHVLAAQAAGRQGQWLPALESTRAAMDLLEDGPALERAQAHLGAAHVQLELGDRSKAQEELATARRMARGLGCAWLDSLVDLTIAEQAFVRGDYRHAAHSLRRGFAVAKKHGLLHPPIWSTQVLGSVCQRALELGIEEPFVRAMVRSNDLMPKTPPLEIASWPWPVRVFTLGRFAVEVDGDPESPNRRVDGKPLLLIKLLVSFGEAEADPTTLADLLWPEGDGDAQPSNLRTVLYRARQLLGDRRAIVADDSGWRLASNWVWSDASACCHCLSLAEELLHGDNGLLAAAGLCERALQLYRGPFLPSLADAAWTRRLRGHLQDDLVTIVCDVAVQLVRCGYAARAARMAQRVVSRNPTAERAYELLVRIFAQRGQWTQAMETYARCESFLAAAGIEPTLGLQAERDRVWRQVGWGPASMDGF
jgi:DNA-binding SARP family transcriptional activator